MSPALQLLIAAYILYRKSLDGLKDKTPEALQQHGKVWVVAKACYLGVLSLLCILAGWAAILEGLRNWQV